MKKHTLEFTTPDDWEPLEPTCWTECPFACLTGLGHECRARKAYRKDNLMICPVARFSGEFQWSRKHMAFEEAARLIDPNTCTEALEKYKRLGEERAVKAEDRRISLPLEYHYTVTL